LQEAFQQRTGLMALAELAQLLLLLLLCGALLQYFAGHGSVEQIAAIARLPRDAR
jgi:hypothetical protein